MRPRAAIALTGTALAAALVVGWVLLRAPEAFPEPAIGEGHEAPLLAVQSASLVEPSAAASDELEAAHAAGRTGIGVAGLAGRVIDSEGGAGLDGFWACLRLAGAPDENPAPGKILAEARSGPEGH